MSFYKFSGVFMYLDDCSRAFKRSASQPFCFEWLFWVTTVTTLQKTTNSQNFNVSLSYGYFTAHQSITLSELSIHFSKLSVVSYRKALQDSRAPLKFFPVFCIIKSDSVVLHVLSLPLLFKLLDISKRLGSSFLLFKIVCTMSISPISITN
jgi:hypothetical protein